MDNLLSFEQKLEIYELYGSNASYEEKSMRR